MFEKCPHPENFTPTLLTYSILTSLQVTLTPNSTKIYCSIKPKHSNYPTALMAAFKTGIDVPWSVHQLGKLGLGNNHPELTLRWKTEGRGADRACRCGVIKARRDATPTHTENKNHLSWPSVERDAEVLQKKLNIPSRIAGQLSVNNLSPSHKDCSKVRIAYKGAPGAFSETAALKAYPLSEMVPCDQFEATFQAVELWLVNKAILPIESSVGGSFHRNYDLLLHHNLHIVGEVKMAIQLCLLGLPGVRKEELKRVLSHPQALAQSTITLSKLDVVKESVDDTAGAAQFVRSNKLRDTGAVSSARAAVIYGLDVLADKIEDDPDSNITRFLILSREPVIPSTDRPFKTSIVFTLEEGAGTLFKALAVFAMRSINLIKIESRPQRKRPLRAADNYEDRNTKYFDYLFYVDFEASMAEPRAQNALGHLQEFATFLRVLGCYPIDTTFQ